MRLPHVKALGIDGFSVDSPVDLKESLEAAGKELTMVGNFNPNELLCMGQRTPMPKSPGWTVVT